mgnify:CR=1 FL=1
MTRRLTGPFLVRALQTCDREIARALPRVLRSADDEAVHDLRVGIRRMRVLLKLARPIFGRHYADVVRAAYTIVHRSTGDLRDAEVLLTTLGELAIQDAAFTVWLAMRKRREVGLRKTVVRGLMTGDFSRASDRLRALLLLPINPARDKLLAKFARQSVGRAHETVTQRDTTDTTDVLGLHALRIAYKGLRYAAEVLAIALPPHFGACAEAAAKFQKRLGEIHDLDVAVVVVRRARGLPLDVKNAAIVALGARRERVVAKLLAEPKILLPRKPADQPKSEARVSAPIITP